MPAIVVRTGPDAGAIYEFGTEVVTIGRDDGQTIQVFDQGTSLCHAEVHRIGEMYFIRDLGSRGGTFVNEERVTEELLRSGDRIRIGATEMAFEEAAGDTGRQATAGTRVVPVESDDLAEPTPPKVHREGANIAAIYTAVQAIVAERDPEHLFARAARFACEATGADRAYVLLRHGREGLSVRASAASGDTAAAAGDAAAAIKDPPTVSREVVRRVLGTNRALITDDASRDDRFRASQSVHTHTIRSVACAPIPGPGGPAGVLYAATISPDKTFGAEDLERLEVLAAVAGTAIEALATARATKEALVRSLLAAIGGAASDALAGPGAAAARVERARRVALYAAAATTAAGLPPAGVRDVQIAALLAEAVPPGRPMATDVPEALALAVRHIGERWDGGGTPDGLAGEAIPRAARIIAVARELDRLLTSGGPGGAPLAPREAFLALSAGAGKAWDEASVRAMAIAHRTGAMFDPEGRLAGL